jgi:hypothetical protein
LISNALRNNLLNPGAFKTHGIGMHRSQGRVSSYTNVNGVQPQFLVQVVSGDSIFKNYLLIDG